MPESWYSGIQFYYYEEWIDFYCPAAMNAEDGEAGYFCSVYRLGREPKETEDTFLGYDGDYYYYLCRPQEYCADPEGESFELYKEMYDSVPEVAESLMVKGALAE